MPYDDKSDLDPRAKAAAALPADDNPLNAPPPPPESMAPPEDVAVVEEDPALVVAEVRALLDKLEAILGPGE